MTWAKYTKDHCIELWIAAGFRVLSVNFPQEIPRLSPRYPQVHFIAANRDASAILGRKTPLLVDILKVLAEQNEGSSSPRGTSIAPL